MHTQLKIFSGDDGNLPGQQLHLGMLSGALLRNCCGNHQRQKNKYRRT
ncbi:MAG: hypothetical protein WCG81_12125 [Candidatus Angelobacter sp.]